MNPFKASANEENNNQLVEAQTLSRAARAIRAFYTNPTMAALLAAIVAASQDGEGIVRQPQLSIGQYMDFFMRHCIQLPAAHVLSRTVHVNATVFLTHCARVCSKRDLAGRLLPEKEDLAESRPSARGRRGHEKRDSHPANSPFNYVMKPKPFTVMCDEERFSRKHMQYKPVCEPPVNNTDYAMHPLWRGIQLVDASDPNAVDFKGNYKLFTYHMDSTSNTLMPDIPFRSRQFSSRRNMLAIIDDVESSAVAFRHLQSARNNELDEDSDMAESIMFERPINNMNISDMSSESDELGGRTSRAIKVEQWNIADESSVSKLEAWQHAFVSRILKAKSAVEPVKVKSEPTDDCDKKAESSDSSARFLDIPRSKPIRATPTSSDSSADESIAEELSGNALPTKEDGADEDPDSPFNPNVKSEPQGAAFSIIPHAGVRDPKLFSYNTNDARVQQLLPVLPRTKFQVQAEANAQAAQIHGSTSLMDMQSYLEARLLKLQRNLEEPCSSEAANRLRLEMIQIRRELINIQPDSEESSSDMDVEPAALTSSRSRSLLNDALDNMLRNISRDKATAMERRLTRNGAGFFGSTRPDQRSPSVSVAVSDELGRKVIKRRLSSNIAAATDSPFDFKPIDHNSAMPEKRRCEEPPTHPSPHTPHDDVPNNMTLASTLTSMTKVKADLRVAQHQLRIRMLTIHGRLEEPCTSREAHRLHEELAGIREKLSTIAEALDATVPDGSSDMDLEVSTTDCDDKNVQPDEPEALQLAATNQTQDIDFNESGFLDSSRLDQTLPRSPTGLSFLESTRLDERPQRPAAADSSNRSEQPLPADSGIVSANVSDQVTPSTLQQSGHMSMDIIEKELHGMEQQAELQAKSLKEETAENDDVGDYEEEDKDQASVRHSTRLHNQPELNEVCDVMEDQSDSEISH
ncbi:uncharacterized protein [Drosophila virilis]|uniref:uncharacterized protein n=1 Tax=Drosophila virilis TaxID=7244 RepID=UPI001395FE0E|nr:uncharacterized protein LOC116652024 [Drosophila virilis]XP_032295569.1 uncharacterized protein LOC116652024 [Drosophila virilis]